MENFFIVKLSPDGRKKRVKKEEKEEEKNRDNDKKTRVMFRKSKLQFN